MAHRIGQGEGANVEIRRSPAARPRAELKRWGFGIAPPKPQTWHAYNDAVRKVRALAQERAVLDRDAALASISVVKGLFNRSRKKDQWDWFIVWQRFGFPTMGHLRNLADGLADLRTAIKEGDEEHVENKISFIKKQNIVGLSHRFLGEREIPRSEEGGVVYILTTREVSDVLIVGTTRGDVVQVADKVTQSMGATVPFGVIHAWRVSDEAKARDAVFSEFSRRSMTSPLDRVLAQSRVLECDAREAISLVDSMLKGASLLEP